MAVVEQELNSNQEVKHLLDETVNGRGWKIILSQYVMPKMKSWRKSLLSNSSMSETERAAKIALLTEFRAVLSSPYKESDNKVPFWIEDALS